MKDTNRLIMVNNLTLIEPNSTIYTKDTQESESRTHKPHNNSN